jgi:hypothetical protein
MVEKQRENENSLMVLSEQIITSIGVSVNNLCV